MADLVSYSLISLDTLKEALEITGNEDDSLLRALINRATDIIESYCNGRRFISTAYTNEEYDGKGSDYLNLKHYPVTTLTSIDRRIGDFANPSWGALSNSFYKLIDDGERGPGQVYYSGKFVRGVRNYRVTYTAGFATIPNDLQQACITLVAFLKNQTKATGMKSETLGRYSYTKSDEEKDIKELGLDAILDAYRTPVIGG